jgi:hypothetical protein
MQILLSTWDFDKNDNVFVADSMNNAIRMINASYYVSTFAGNGSSGYKDGYGLESRFKYPTYLAFDLAGDLLVSDTNNRMIRKINRTGYVSTYAGTGMMKSDDGPRLSSSFLYPSGIKVDSMGNIFVSDSSSNKIRMIDLNGIVGTVAGNSTSGSQDGPALSSTFNSPRGLALGQNSEMIFIADFFNHKIRKCLNCTSIASMETNTAFTSISPTTSMETNTAALTAISTTSSPLTPGTEPNNLFLTIGAVAGGLTIIAVMIISIKRASSGARRERSRAIKQETQSATMY